jgi:hypothetical protein
MSAENENNEKRKNQSTSPDLKMKQALWQKKKIKNSILISSDTHYRRGTELVVLTCKTSHNINNQRLDQVVVSIHVN